MKYLITERQYRLLLEENIYPSEEEYRQALKDVEDLLVQINPYQWKSKKDSIERGMPFEIKMLKSYAETEKHKNAADIIFNYHKKTWDEEEERSKRVIDLTGQYESGNITHNAKPGDVIRINPGYGWIYGEVYLTQGNDVGYHGGFIRDLNDFMDKRKGLYLTKSLADAWAWPGVAMTQNYRRVYEVKIKSGSLFIDSSPAGQDEGSARGLEDEHNTLTQMGIVGMADKNFRYGKHVEGVGTTGSEALILDVSAIESFRAVPFSELIRNDELKSNKSMAFEKFSKWYDKLKEKVMEKYFYNELQNAKTSRDEYQKNNPNKSYVDFLMSTDTKLENFKKSMSQQLEDIIDSLSDDEVIEILQKSGANTLW